MKLHWSKFQLISIGQTYKLRTPTGEAIPTKDVMQYLGVHLRADGHVCGEIHQKIGHAWGDFCKLERFWKRTALPLARKLEVFEAVTVSQLLYGLNSAWLNKADIRRLDGFYCRCLRVLLRIPPSYVSRVSNQTVLERAGKQPIAKKLLKQQLLLYGTVARAAENDELRKRTFIQGTTMPATQQYVRKVGRPRNEWAGQLRSKELQITADIHDAANWRAAVIQYCS